MAVIFNEYTVIFLYNQYVTKISMTEMIVATRVSNELA